jgi:hypothetical protein
MKKTRYTTEQLTDRWEDQRDIKNLMGKYANCVVLNREAELFDLVWSKQQADVCMGFNEGWYVGAKAIQGYYQAIHERTALVASLLQKKFPEKLGKKSADEIYGMGPFKVKPLACPVIEVSGDGKTAKGLWYCQGAYAEVYTCGPSANWTWGYVAADFVREEGTWKLWHLQNLNDVDSRCGFSWGKPVPALPALPEFAKLKDFSVPACNSPGQLRQFYSAARPMTGAPRLPEPYSTFGETFSYGAGGEHK